MAYFLFLDESGGDRTESPYEVLAGIAVEDRDVWNLIDAMKNAEERAFGVRYVRDHGEIKGKKFLKRKTFRHAAQMPPINEEERRTLARACLASGGTATRPQITALATTVQGAVVFDELERSQANILIGQMEEYFLRTVRGRTRSRQIIPEPLL